MSNTLVPKDDWLDSETDPVTVLSSASTTVSAGGAVTSNTISNCSGSLTSYPYYWSVTYPARPIRLTLSEIERLRKAAKADAKIKAILSKFTDQIEITVDFE